jgi:integrase/recombinase XerD
MPGKRVANQPKVRGHSAIARSHPDLAQVIFQTVRLWRKAHLGYDQTKYVVEQVRRRLRLDPPRTRRRSVERLDRIEVERLISNGYRLHSKYGLMIKTLFYTSARVDEFVHLRVEDVHLESEPPQVPLTHAKGQASRYVPILPIVAGTADASPRATARLFVRE